MASETDWLTKYPEAKQESWLDKYPEATEKPFFDLSDTLSATGRAFTSLGTSVPASMRQAFGGLENPWQRSEGYAQSRADMQALQQELEASDAAAMAGGDASSVSSSIREATPSLGFSGSTLVPSLAAGAVTALATKSPLAARSAAAGTSLLMAYRMAGAQFLDDSRERIDNFFQEKLQRPLTPEEQNEAYEELLPLARKFGAAEAGPEALGNMALGGAGKYIRKALGGKNGIMSLASNALSKVTGAKAVGAGVGAAAGEVGTEAITAVEQDRINKEFEQSVLRGEAPESVVLPDRTVQDYTQGITDVAPTTLAMTGLMGLAGLGPTAINRGYQALRPQAEQQVVETEIVPEEPAISPGLTAAVNTADSIVTTAENTSSDVSQATTAARNIIQGVVNTPQPQEAPAELPAVTPSPAMEQPKNLSQTITDSNGEIAPEMSVLPPTVQAGAGVGEAIQAPKPKVVGRQALAPQVQEMLAKAAAIKAGTETAPSTKDEFVRKMTGQVAPPITPQGTPTPATEGTVMPGGSAMERDATRLSRGKPRESIAFKKPVITPLGEVVGYSWSSQLVEDVDKAGEPILRRVSNWEEAANNAETGRDIVHRFLIRKPDGSASEVSLESTFGKMTASDKQTIKSVISAAKRLPFMRAELAELQDLQKRSDEDYQRTQKLVPDPAKFELREPDVEWRKKTGDKVAYLDGVFLEYVRGSDLNTKGELPSKAKFIYDNAWKWQGAQRKVEITPAQSDRLKSITRSVKKAEELLKKENVEVAKVTADEQPSSLAETGPPVSDMKTTSVTTDQPAPISYEPTNTKRGRQGSVDVGIPSGSAEIVSPSGSTIERPSLGVTGKQILGAWRSIQGVQVAPGETVVGRDVNGGGTYAFINDRLVKLRRNDRGFETTYTEATDGDWQNVSDALDRGALQVEVRKITGLGGYQKADAGKTVRVLHQATGRPLQEFLDTPEGSAYEARMQKAIADRGPKQSPQTTTVAAPTETAAPSAKEAAVASVVQQPVEGSIPTVEQESAITAIESTEKTDVAKEAMRFLEADLTDTQRAKWTPEMFTAAQAFFDSGGKDFDSLKKAIKFPRVVQQAYLKADKEAAAEQTRREAADAAMAREVEKAEKEQAKLEADQKQREELGLKTLNSLIEKTRTNVVQGTVKSSDANQAVAILNRSGEIPNVLFTWIGTSKDFLADPANRVRYPETWAAVSANSKIEGMSENGQPIVFTDNVGVSDLDRKLANLQGTTPEVAAVRRVILHENIHKGIFFLSMKEKMQIFSFLRRMYSPQELDSLAESYSEYSDWRTNQVSYFSILEEAMTRDFDSMVEIPRDGILAEFMQFLRGIWQKITGKTSEPTLKDYKDVFRLIRNSLKNSEKANADMLVNGGGVRMSMSEFLSNVTPEQDAEYMAAVESGDVAKQQAMVDAAAKAAGYDVSVFHGTGDILGNGRTVGGENFTEFKPSTMGALGPGIYVATDEGNATSYAKRFVNPRLIKGYAKITNPFKGGTVAEVGKKLFETFPSETDAGTIEKLQEAGFDAVWADKPESTKFGVVEPEINLLKPNQFKSADPVTRDKQGNVIPLSRRFQTASNDIRFSKVEYDSPNDAAFNSGAEVARNTDYDERDKEVRSTIRAAYDIAPKTNGPSVPLDELFSIVQQSMPDVTETEFSRILQGLYEDSGALLIEGESISVNNQDAAYMKAVAEGDMEKAQKMVDDGKATMNRLIFDALGVRPEATQIATTIHRRLEDAGVISKEDFSESRGMVYGDGKGAASSYLGADSYEPFPPEGFSPTYSGDRSSGIGNAIERKYDTILNTFVLNVVEPETRKFIVRDIANLLKQGGRAVFVTRGTDVLNSKPIQEYGEMARLQKKGSSLTYQKGFSQAELIEYLKSTLGDGFVVSAVKGGSSSDVRAQIIKNTNITLPNPIVGAGKGIQSQINTFTTEGERAGSAIIMPPTDMTKDDVISMLRGMSAANPAPSGEINQELYDTVLTQLGDFISGSGNIPLPIQSYGATKAGRYNYTRQKDGLERDLRQGSGIGGTGQIDTGASFRDKVERENLEIQRIDSEVSRNRETTTEGRENRKREAGARPNVGMAGSGYTFADYAQIASRIGARVQEVSNDIGGGLAAMADGNGATTILINATQLGKRVAGTSFGLDEDGAIETIGNALVEELIHAADLAVQREAWIASGRRKPFTEFATNSDKSMLEDMRKVVASSNDPVKATRILFDAIQASRQLYGAGATPSDIDELFSSPKGNISLVMSEFVRQMIQQDMHQTVSEASLFRRFIERVMKMLQKIRDAIAPAKAGEFGDILKNRINETEMMLAMAYQQTGARASMIDPEDAATKQFAKNIKDINSGTAKAPFGGVQFTNFMPIDRAVKSAEEYSDAAIKYVNNLEKEGVSLDDIANSVISPAFLESIGIEQDLMAQDALTIEVRQRVDNAAREEKSPGRKKQLSKLSERLSAFWQGVGSKKGQHLGQRRYLVNKARYSWMFIREIAEKAMKEARTNILISNFGGENATSFTQNSYADSDKANQQAVDEVAKDVVNNDEWALIKEGEQVFEGARKTMWERVKFLVAQLAIFARRKSIKASNAKASFTDAQMSELNAILQMSDDEAAKAEAKVLAELDSLMAKLVGDESPTDTPAEKAKRKKRKEIIDTVEKRVAEGQPIEPTAEEIANEIEIAENKASQIVYRFEELYRQGFKNPPEGMSKKEQKDSIIRAFRDQVKNPVSFEQFAERLDALKVGEEVSERLFLTASRERADLARMKKFKIEKRRVEIADKQASRLIYSTEERLRQGSKDLSKSTSGDSINKAFKDQVSDPVEKSKFAERLAKLDVSPDVAERLFKTAEREKTDLEAMAAFNILQGPKALQRMINEINNMRRGEEIPLRTPIPWRQLLSQSAKTVEEYRQRIFDAISANEELKNATPEQKARLADLFAEAWESNRTRILDGMLERMIRAEEAKKNLSKEGAKALQAQRMRIVEDINLGIFDNDELAKRMAEKFGIKSEFTETEREKINSLIEVLQDEGLNAVKRQVAAYKLLEVLQGELKIPVVKMIADFWVSSVLSGPNTIVSIGLAVASGAFELSTALSRVFIAGFTNPKQLPSELAGAYKTLARLLSAYGRQARIAWQYLVSGDPVFLDPSMNDVTENMQWGNIGKSNKLAEQMAKSDKILVKSAGLFMRTVSRLLTALDVFNSGLTKEGSLSIVFRQIGLDPAKIAEMEKKSDLKPYKDAIIQQDFKNTPPKSARDKAILDSYALADMMKELDKLGNVSENANFFGQQGAMTLDPSGLGGVGYRAIRSLVTNAEAGADRFLKQAQRGWNDSAQNGDRILSGLELAFAYFMQFAAYNAANFGGVRFARFAGNKFNQGLSFIPGIGFARAFEAEFDPNRISGKEAFIDSIRRNQLVGVMLSVAGYQILKAIADEPDDEKRGWFINGGWGNLTPEKKQQKLAAGEKEYTIGINGKVFNYANWPISSALAAIGSLSDLIRFSPDQWNDKNVAQIMASAAMSGAAAAADIPALSQFQEIFGNSLSSKDPNEKRMERFAKVMSSYAGGFVPRFLKDIDYAQDPNLRKYETLWEKTASHIPVYRRYEGKEYYDILGQQIQRNVYPGSREFMVKPTDPAYKVLGALNSRGIWLTPANAEHRMVGKGARRRSLTQEEADNYSLETGKGYKQMLLRYGQRALQMPTERAKAFLLDKADEVRDRALKKVYRGYKPAT